METNGTAPPPLDARQDETVVAAASGTGSAEQGGDEIASESWAEADFLVLDAEDENDADSGISAPEEGFEASSLLTATKTLPPWMARPNDYRCLHPLMALHNEIVSFCQLMELMPSEIRQREELEE